MTINVFISYAHKDRALRDELATHLSNLRTLGVINDWYDGDIVPGTEWESQYINSTELKQAIKRHEAGKARVIPILLRATDYEGAPFEKLQMLPTGAKPVQGSHWNYRDEAWQDVIKGLRVAIKDLQGPTAANP